MWHPPLRMIALRTGYGAVRVAAHGSPVRPGTLLTVRRISRVRNALLFGGVAAGCTSKGLRHPRLAAELGGRDIWAWSLGAPTLNYLERRIHELRPDALLELGSGVGTACLTQYMADLHGPGLRVFSVEENEGRRASTEALLAELGLTARVVHAPLRAQRVEGRDTLCYDLDETVMRRLLGDRRPAMLVVDGPAARGGASRFATLPLVLAYLADGARVFLDDARRDAELGFASEWARLPGVAIDGVLLVGTGLLVGRVTR